MYSIHIQTEPRKNWRIHWHCVDFVAVFSCFSPAKTACILVYSLSRSLWKAVPPYSILTALPSQVSSVKSLTDVRFTSLKFPRLSFFRCDSHEQPPLIITVFPWSSAQNNVQWHRASSLSTLGYLSCCMDMCMSNLFTCSLFSPSLLWTVLHKPTLHFWAQGHGRHEGIKE